VRASKPTKASVVLKITVLTREGDSVYWLADLHGMLRAVPDS